MRTSPVVRLLPTLRWHLAALVLAAGVAPAALAAPATVDCHGSDDSRTCLVNNDDQIAERSMGNGMGMKMPHSLLQVSKPYKAMNKAQLLHDEDRPSKAANHHAASSTAAQSEGSKHSSLATATVAHSKHRLPSPVARQPPQLATTLDFPVSHDVRRHGRHGAVGHRQSAAVPPESGAKAVSFIQTAESVLASANVVAEVVEVLQDDGSRPVAIEEVHVAGWPRAVNVVMLVNLVLLVTWGLFWAVTGRPFILRIGRFSQVCPDELPKPEPTSPSSSACSFKESLLPEAASSFSIPLTHHTEVGSSKVLCFNIARYPEGPPVSAMVTCQPEGSTLANVQLFAGADGGGNFTSPLASCRLVHSTSDVESRNMQGAMMSWLSLLMNEKEGAEAAAVATMESDDPERAGPPQRDRVNLHGMAEDLIAAGTAGGGEGKDTGMRLEVRDSVGLVAGTLDFLEPDPASKPGRYALIRQGKTVFDIEAKSDCRSIEISRQDKVLALATHLGTRRNPDQPETVPEEEDHLQVDIRDGIDRCESALLLTCTLAMMVFKPKDRKECLNVEDGKADIESCPLAEATDCIKSCPITKTLWTPLAT